MKVNAELTDQVFNEPQKQSRIGILVEILYSLQKTIKSWWPVLVLIIFRLKDYNPLYVWGAGVIILLLIMVKGFLNYHYFLFHIDEKKEEFIITSGVFNKKRIVLQLSKIQQVNINQSFIQKLVNVYAVELETAGTTKSEATIHAVSKATAAQLRVKLMNFQYKGEAVAGKVFSEEAPLNFDSSNAYINISLSSLIKVGITSDYLKSMGLLLVFVSAIYSNIKDIWFNDDEIETEFFNYVSTLNYSQYILLIFVSFVLVIFLFNLLRIVIRFYNFKIIRHGKSFLLSYGLFNTKNTLIQPYKVQTIALVTNYFQRKLNLKRLFIHQASSNADVDKKATLQIPGCNNNEAKEIFKLIYGSIPVKGKTLKPDFRKLISSLIGFIIVPIIIYFILAFFYTEWLQYIYFLPGYLLFVAVVIYFGFKNSRLYINDNFIVMKSGVWDIKEEYLEPFKIQAITTSQKIWHVKSDVGHVTLHTAGGDVTFRFGNFSAIKMLVNQWLYQVETSEKEWM